MVEQATLIVKCDLFNSKSASVRCIRGEILQYFESAKAEVNEYFLYIC